MPGYLGEFKLFVTEKNRLVIPASFRELYEQNDDKSLYVSYQNNGWLEVYDSIYWRKIAEELGKLSFLHSDVRDYQRLLYSQTQIQEFDQQGRIVLSEQMLECLKHESNQTKARELVVVGAGEHVEIWTAQRWQIKKDSLMKSHSALSDRLAFMLNNKR